MVGMHISIKGDQVYCQYTVGSTEHACHMPLNEEFCSLFAKLYGTLRSRALNGGCESKLELDHAMCVELAKRMPQQQWGAQ